MRMTNLLSAPFLRLGQSITSHFISHTHSTATFMICHHTYKYHRCFKKMKNSNDEPRDLHQAKVSRLATLEYGKPVERLSTYSTL